MNKDYLFKYEIKHNGNLIEDETKLVARHPPSPSSINWKNLYISSTKRCLFIFMFIFLVLVVSLIMLHINLNVIYMKTSPSIYFKEKNTLYKCAEDEVIPESLVLFTIKQPEKYLSLAQLTKYKLIQDTDKMNTYFTLNRFEFCFCKYRHFWKKKYNWNEFSSEIKSVCNEQDNYLFNNNIFSMLAPIVLISTSMINTLIIPLIGSYFPFHSKNFMSCLELILVIITNFFNNTGVFFMLSNTNLFQYMFDWEKLTTTKVSVFQVNYFELIYLYGDTIQITMMIDIFKYCSVPLIIFYIKIFLNKRSMKNAKLVCEHIKLSIPPEFGIETKFGNFVVTFGTLMMLSCHIPMIVICAFINFILVYWCEKFMFLYLVKKPIRISKNLFKIVLFFMCLAQILGCLYSIIIYGNPMIFPSTKSFFFEENIYKVKDLNYQSQNDLFNKKQMNLYQRTMFQLNRCLPLSCVFALMFILILFGSFFLLFPCKSKKVTKSYDYYEYKDICDKNDLSNYDFKNSEEMKRGFYAIDHLSLVDSC